MYRYQNTRTGALIRTTTPITGGLWVLIDEPTKEKTTEPKPVKAKSKKG